MPSPQLVQLTKKLYLLSKAGILQKAHFPGRQQRKRAEILKASAPWVLTEN